MLESFSNEDGNGNENAPKLKRFNEKKNNHSARAFYILVHMFASSAKQQREMRKLALNSKFLLLFPYFNTVRSNLDPGEFASILDVSQVRIMAKELQKWEVICWNDVLVAAAGAIAVAVVKAP